ncbi:hypothetical protein GCM10007940_47310 [Portibacter lacus]|uniref:Uncharacterized protein n=1 Tax=Portibacter lacus TaxID=1099794 RepID=A0AA37WIQ5_9BACT|nr:hypothetical protein GCM10007940_47310 [Portibacter lacus]
MHVQNVQDKKLETGSSGMAQVNDNTYLAVYDLKNFQKGYRLGLISSYADSITVVPIKVENWVSEGGIPSDLEAISVIPDRPYEFLMTESGNWQGNLGRIFHIKLNIISRSAEVLGVFQLPMIHKNDIGLTGDQYEGIACVKNDDGAYQVILAERGGSSAYPNGLLKWANIDFTTHQINFSEQGKTGIPVAAPGEWSNASSKRDLTDLYIDKNGELWAAASQDLGDSGPFNSIIYKVGNTNSSNNAPFTVFGTLEVYKSLSGYKIEALSGPSIAAPASKFTFGTEDEIYGGTWRPIE